MLTSQDLLRGAAAAMVPGHQAEMLTFNTKNVLIAKTSPRGSLKSVIWDVSEKQCAGYAIGCAEHQIVFDGNFVLIGTTTRHEDEITIWNMGTIVHGYSLVWGLYLAHFDLIGHPCSYSIPSIAAAASHPLKRQESPRSLFCSI